MNSKTATTKSKLLAEQIFDLAQLLANSLRDRKDTFSERAEQEYLDHQKENNCGN